MMVHAQVIQNSHQDSHLPLYYSTETKAYCALWHLRSYHSKVNSQTRMADPMVAALLVLLLKLYITDKRVGMLNDNYVQVISYL